MLALSYLDGSVWKEVLHMYLNGCVQPIIKIYCVTQSSPMQPLKPTKLPFWHHPKLNIISMRFTVELLHKVVIDWEGFICFYSVDSQSQGLFVLLLCMSICTGTSALFPWRHYLTYTSLTASDSKQAVSNTQGQRSWRSAAELVLTLWMQYLVNLKWKPNPNLRPN